MAMDVLLGGNRWREEMGYLTEFGLTVTLEGGEEAEYEGVDECFDGDDGVLGEIEEEMRRFGIENRFHEATKWYACETDMRCLSRRFPGVLFTVTGDGEDKGDLWVAYFLDGRMQRDAAEVVYPGFDPEKLDCGKGCA